MPSQSEQFLYDIILTKAMDWAYEREWRIVGRAVDSSIKDYDDGSFNPKALSKVFLGCKIEKQDEKDFLQLCQVGPFSHVEVYKAQQKQKSFGLDFEKIK